MRCARHAPLDVESTRRILANQWDALIGEVSILNATMLALPRAICTTTNTTFNHLLELGLKSSHFLAL